MRTKKTKSKWGGFGSGMKKHARSGIPTNPAVGRARSREVNRKLEKQAELKKKAKGQMFGSVQEAFKVK